MKELENSPIFKDLHKQWIQIPNLGESPDKFHEMQSQHDNSSYARMLFIIITIKSPNVIKSYESILIIKDNYTG